MTIKRGTQFGETMRAVKIVRRNDSQTITAGDSVLSAECRGGAEREDT